MKLLGSVLYWLVRNLTNVLSRVWFRATYEGRENVPATGPFVLAPIHRSNVDFALTSVLTKRRMRYMGKESLWDHAWFGRVLTSMGAYPVVRGTADREAMRRTVEVLRQGDGLVLFPEGTRQSGPVVGELFEGAAYVASRSGAPIVPVGIGGTERAMGKGVRFPRPVKVRVVVGPPIHPEPLPEGRSHPPRRAVRHLTERLRIELQRLFDEAERRDQTPVASPDVPPGGGGDVNQTGPSDVPQV